MTTASDRPTRRPQAVVALGASAGGLESLGLVLGGLPKEFPAPILVALHLDPTHRSQAVLLLQRRTRLHVETAQAGSRVLAGTVYVAPPDHHLELRAGKVRLTQAARVSYSRPSVDVLFTSVAADYGPAAVAVVLSGTGSDGSAGLADVKARGGLAVAEDPATAGFAGMPSAARQTGLLDAVLPVRQVAAFLERAVAHRVTVSERQWLHLLALVEARSGARFSKYRSTTLHRRLQQRLVARGCRTMAAYLALVERDAGELDRLQAAFLIKVSSFFRDPASWRSLVRQVDAAQAKGSDGVRAWSAGCASGEEAYSLAILLARTFGIGRSATWKVFATDLDDGALGAARAARYGPQQVGGVSKRDLARFFVRDGRGWRVGKDLRSRVVFGRHDLLHDPPLSDIDVLACRNVLIYFSPQQRERTLRRLALAVKPGGILFLGNSEALRPLAGFLRVGRTTFFRRAGVSPAVPSRPKRNAGAKGLGKSPAPAKAKPAKARRQRDAGDSRFAAQQDLNEELQSRNEELETVNEELQSLNDELSTMEEQMRGIGEAARRSTDFLHTILDTSPDPVIACDEADRVTFWGKAAAKAFRLSSAQALGGDLFDLVPALDDEPLRSAVRAILRSPREGSRTARIGGTTYQVDALARSAGKMRGYVLRVHDTPA